MIDSLALADGDLCEVREWSEVARGADRALRRNQGMNTAIEHRAERLGDDGTNAGEAFCDSIGAQDERGARFRFAEGGADAAGMTSNQIHLKLLNLIGRNANRGELAETG